MKDLTEKMINICWKNLKKPKYLERDSLSMDLLNNIIMSFLPNVISTVSEILVKIQQDF